MYCVSEVSWRSYPPILLTPPGGRERYEWPEHDLQTRLKNPVLGANTLGGVMAPSLEPTTRIPRFSRSGTIPRHRKSQAGSGPVSVVSQRRAAAFPNSRLPGVSSNAPSPPARARSRHPSYYLAAVRDGLLSPPGFLDPFKRCHQLLLRYRYMVSGANTPTSSPDVRSTQPI